MKNLFCQLASYGLIGLLCSALDTALFSMLVYLFHGNEIASNFISVSIGITLSFVLNRKFTFDAKDHIARRYVSFFLVGMCGLLLSEGLLLFATINGIEPIVMKLISVFIVAVFQFILNKFISFRPGL